MKKKTSTVIFKGKMGKQRWINIINNETSSSEVGLFLKNYLAEEEEVESAR